MASLTIWQLGRAMQVLTLLNDHGRLWATKCGHLHWLFFCLKESDVFGCCICDDDKRSKCLICDGKWWKRLEKWRKRR